MMNDETTLIPSGKISQDNFNTPVNVEAEIAGSVSEYDMQIWQLQSEVQLKKKARVNRAKLLLYQMKEQIKEFEDRWFEEISEAASMELLELSHGTSICAGESEGTTFSIYTNHRSVISFKYILQNFTFDIEPNDEFEDIDIHDFHLRCYRLDKDDLFKVGHVFGELEGLIPYLVKWNRERESLRSDIRVQMITINMELQDLDEELTLLREQIHQLRIASFLAGNSISFDDRRPRRVRYCVGEFVYADQLRLVQLSPSRKTCTFEVIPYEKNFRSTAYYPGKKHLQPVVYEKVRVSTLVKNFYEGR
jgi:hypothetical protein